MKIDSVNQVGLYANRPAFGIAGRLYFATDQNKTYYDTGSAWSELNPTVAAQYSTNAGQTISTGTGTIVDFEDKVYDTHDAVTIGASWKFTAPFDGYYNISMHVLFEQTNQLGAGEMAYLGIRRNNAPGDPEKSVQIWISTSSTTMYLDLGGTIDMYLAKNDYISAIVYQNSGSNLPLFSGSSAWNWISIHKV